MDFLSSWNPRRCVRAIVSSCVLRALVSFDVASASSLSSSSSSSSSMCDGDRDTLSHNVEMDITMVCRPGVPDAFFGIQFASAAASSSGSSSSSIVSNGRMTTTTTTTPLPYHGIMAHSWSIDLDRNVHCDQTFRVDSYSVFDKTIPMGIVDHPEHLNRVNWFINNYEIGKSHLNIPDPCHYNGKLRWEEYNAVVWNLLDDNDEPYFSDPDDHHHYTECVVSWLEEQARDHGNHYGIECLNPGAKMGVILTDSAAGGTTTNTSSSSSLGLRNNRGAFLAEIPLKEIDTICNCQLVTREEAEEACRNAEEPTDRELCVFDVMANNDKQMAEAY